MRNPVGTHVLVGKGLARHATAGVPFIAETPGSREPGNPDLALLEELRR